MNVDELEKREINLINQIKELGKETNECLEANMQITDPDDYDIYIKQLGDIIQNFTTVRKNVIAMKFYSDELDNIYKKKIEYNNIELQNNTKDDIIVSTN